MTGPTWGGCIEVLQWILTAGRFPADPSVLDGGVLLLESSEDLIPASEFGYITRSLGERGLLAAVDAVVVARAAAATREDPRTPESRAPTARRSATSRIETVRPLQPGARSSSSACPSGTRGRNGCSPTAAP